MTTEECQVRWAGPHAVVAMPAEIDAVNAGKIRQGLLSAVGQLVPIYPALEAALAGTSPGQASTPDPGGGPGGTAVGGGPQPRPRRPGRSTAVVSCWQAHVQADLGTVAAGADFDQIAQLIRYP